MSRTYEQLEPVISALDERISANASQIDGLPENVTELNERLQTVEENLPKESTIWSAIPIVDKPYNCYLKGASNSQYDATAVIDGVNIKVTSVNGQTETLNKFFILLIVC